MELGAEFFDGLCIPTVSVFCLILGFVLKRWIKDTGDKYIPTALAIAGAVMGCAVCSQISVESMVRGAFSGLAGTGMHQMFKQIKKNEE